MAMTTGATGISQVGFLGVAKNVLGFFDLIAFNNK
jgi:hypothetical protein